MFYFLLEHRVSCADRKMQRDSLVYKVHPNLASGTAQFRKFIGAYGTYRYFRSSSLKKLASYGAWLLNGADSEANESLYRDICYSTTLALSSLSCVTSRVLSTSVAVVDGCHLQPSQKSFRTKQKLAKASRQNRYVLVLMHRNLHRR